MSAMVESTELNIASKYNTTIEGCAVFNWTVLILKMTTGRSSLKIL